MHQVNPCLKWQTGTVTRSLSIFKQGLTRVNWIRPPKTYQLSQTERAWDASSQSMFVPRQKPWVSRFLSVVKLNGPVVICCMSLATENISTESDWKILGCIKSIHVCPPTETVSLTVFVSRQIEWTCSYRLSQTERSWDASRQSAFESADSARETRSLSPLSDSNVDWLDHVVGLHHQSRQAYHLEDLWTVSSSTFQHCIRGCQYISHLLSWKKFNWTWSSAAAEASDNRWPGQVAPLSTE